MSVNRKTVVLYITRRSCVNGRMKFRLKIKRHNSTTSEVMSASMTNQTPLRERIVQKRSPSHIKTMDILAKSTTFAAQSPSNLRKYCAFARSEGGCPTVEEAGKFLLDRYAWEISTRVEDMKQAWRESDPERTVTAAESARTAGDSAHSAGDSGGVVVRGKPVVHADRVSSQYMQISNVHSPFHHQCSPHH